MEVKLENFLLTASVVVAALYATGSTGIYLSNLHPVCFHCLCFVSTQCEFSHGCTGGYCGPFNISKIYWVDAGRPVLPKDDPKRTEAWADCARSYDCARKIVEGYLQRFAKDCNGDGVTNCYDYMMINGNGGYGCSFPLNGSANGRRWLQRYEECEYRHKAQGNKRF